VRYFLAAYLSRRTGDPLEIDTETWPPGRRVVFTHDFFDVYQDADEPVRVLFAAELAAKPLVLLVRDPRDVAVSYYYHKRFRQGVHLPSLAECVLSGRYGIERQSRYVLQLLDFFGPERPGRLLLTYEGLMADRERALAPLVRFLFGEPADPAVMEHALAASTFAAMRELDQRLTRSGEFLGECLGLPERHEARRRDERALKVRSGRVGGHRRELDLLTRLRVALLPQTRRLCARLRKLGASPRPTPTAAPARR